MEKEKLKVFEKDNCENCINFYMWWDCSIWLAVAEGSEPREGEGEKCRRREG